MMMQILQAGGIPLKTDALREPDANNPKGYYEWENIKRLQLHPELIDQAAGMAVKVVSVHLSSLPKGRRYDLIWMDRPIEEIVRSQEQMILSRHPERELPPLETRIRGLTAHRDSALNAFRKFAKDKSNQLRLLEVSYHDCLRNPATSVAAISEFLSGRLVDSDAAQACIESKLCHFYTYREEK